jgi:multicomponent Na+:H+ antiporter subunit D
MIIVINTLLSKKCANKISLYLALFGAITQMAASVTCFCLLAGTDLHRYEFPLLWDITKPGSERFAVTSISLILLFFIGFVSLVSILVANETVKTKKVAYVNLLMTLILGMNGMVIVTDLFSLYVFLEIVGISSFVLVAMFKTETGLEGAFKYLVMSSLASILILTGLSFIFMQTGSLQYSEIGLSAPNTGTQSQQILVYVAFIFIIAGFAIKTGAVPFHSWLPDAHQSANTAVSVLLSGIVIKIAGIYGLIVLTELFPEVAVIRVTLAILGIVSIITGALFALRQDHFKRIVAYSSVSQMGYILLGISTGTTLGMAGAVIHMFNHATMKCTLFSNAAALHEQTGTLDINEMGGLQSKMPLTGFSSVAAFLSAAGIPPFGGFWSKLLIIMALWNSDSEVLAAVALFASILTAAYFLRLQKKVFFGKTAEKYNDIKEVRGTVRFAQIMLTVVIIGSGLVFPLVLLGLNASGLL